MLTKIKSIRINLITIIAVYLLILVGGIVRSVGAGMGCPDWPKCFGSYVPPISAEHLPIGYEDWYVQKRLDKNARLSSVLKSIGLDDLAIKVTSDSTIEEVTYFDVTKAWVEYVNRLIGVLIGLLIIVNLIYSLKFWRDNKFVVVLAGFSFILVLFQGWIGSLVVSTNLIPGFISFHMLLALLLVALLLVQRFKMLSNYTESIWGKSLLVLVLVMFLIQIVLGISVREKVDLFNHTTSILRSDWIREIGSVFLVHRSFSLIILAVVGFLVYNNWKVGAKMTQFYLLAAVLMLEVLIGAILSYFSLPALLQPLHLLLGSISFGLIFYLFLIAYFRKVS